jgi:NAD(P) transhydrogenase subunit beta
LSGSLVDVAYLAAAVLFVLALKALSHPRVAVRGNALGAAGMLLAVSVTLFDRRIVRFDLIAAGLGVGAVVGAALAVWIRMTAMPQLVALFNGFGGGASALVAGSVLVAAASAGEQVSASVLSGLVGASTLSGSLVAVVKLAGVLPDFGVSATAQRGLVALFALSSIASGGLVLSDPGNVLGYAVLLAASSILGIVLVTPIGGADMPVVVAFLNALSGLAAAATGFVLMNQALIISGSLVGASGLILTRIMCRAMNRTLVGVLLSGGWAPTVGGAASAGGRDRPVKSTSAEEVALVLEGARRVVLVPGYGMAVAQAQHAVAALSKKLEEREVSVDFAVHPVAGRMPGHMNVLLAEADVPYEKLKDLEAANLDFPRTDVALVIGANDVVNPAARTDRASPLYGMPILDVDRARTVVVLKRSLKPGFAGVDNPLFVADNTVMLFGDARETVVALTHALG